MKGQIQQKGDEIGRLSKDMYSLTKKRYTNLKTGEGKVTFIMILLLAGSVVVILFNGVPYSRSIASIIFLAGLICLIIRVHIRGKGND
ncbi:MAG: hypothetical protein WBX01_12830 [Nitrososphaeraceae archaeon]